MATKLFKKRLELLAEIGPVIESESGNFYVILDEITTEYNKEVNQFSVTKSKLDDQFKQISYVKKSQELIMINKEGNLLYKGTITGAYFRNLGISTIRNLMYRDFFSKVLKLFLYNKRCEWIASSSDPLQLIPYFNLLKSFKSLKDLLKHLNYTAALHDLSDLPKLIVGYSFQNKTNVIQSDFDILRDTARMIVQNGFVNYYDSDKSIRNIHDEIVVEINKKSLDNYSTEVIRPLYAGEVDLALLESNIKFIPLDTARKLAENGFKLHHCIGSYAHKLEYELFYELIWGEESYSLRSNRSTLLECRGKYNSTPPKELLDKLSKCYTIIKPEPMPF
jgi:hypothetical protein